MPRYIRNVFPKTSISPWKIAALCAVISGLMAPAAFAQSISLPQALSTAMDANPDMAAARQEIGIADGARKQAGLIPNPTISYDVEDTRRSTSQTTVTLSQTLELGGKRGARVDVATYGQTAAQLELDRRVNALRAEVVQAFYAALRAQTGLDLAKQSLELTERGLRIVDGRVRAGKSSPVEATRAQVQLAEAKLQVRRAETEKATAYQQLAQITGSSVTVFDRLDSPTLSPGLPPDAEELLSRLDQTAEMRQAVVQIDKSDASLGSEKAQRIPDLTVSVGSQYDRSVRERVNTVGLSMPLPLFDRNQGNILSASRRADQARDQRNAVELRLRSETQTAVNQWATAMQEVESYDKTILPSAQQAVETATRGFEMGKFGFIEVLDAQRTLIVARGQYLDSLATATNARAQVERVYGDVGSTAGVR
ncbi:MULTISPECIES: TolC family protein [Pseudomonas]|uniref:TolC family protein n=5 Tax=Pseudomonas TaxID=286 RepID=A0A7Y1ADA3_PSEVE|nr:MULTISPECIES: TolC family protein [Pseudomonas]NQD55138.1 TolC family protein [Pseudomonas sp. CM25]KAA0943601.1 TolC family protein [Pseudomonas sp. ANT_H4]KAA0946177.1 TolC family protein [Pseudomonas sp. ANT_H14]KAA8706245.1 TolC family protein [Pseudomonas proteolytica]MBA1222054.1 TolC family protein [Pseudomonas fulva]